MRGQETTLKKIIREKGLSQVRVARDVGTAPCHLNLIVNGWLRPGDTLRSRIAAVLGEPESKIFPSLK